MIDGANVGFYGQNHAGHAPEAVDFQQIDAVLRHAVDDLGRNALVVLPTRGDSRERDIFLIFLV